MAKSALKMAPKPAKYELLSIAKIAMRCNLDRATCKKRLDANGYEPDTEEAKLKLYRFDAAMEAELTESNDKLAEVRIRKETADAQLKELKYREAVRELVPYDEAVELTQKVVNWLNREFSVRMPREIAAQLGKAKTTAARQKLLKIAVDKRFKRIRENVESVLQINGV